MKHLKKQLLTALFVAAGLMSFAQVGVGTTTPTTTLDVVGDAATATSLDGITAPRLTGDQLSAKTYTATETGALVYVTAADTTPTGQTINVTAAGYYYFDGSVWNHWSLGAGGGGTSIADADGNTIIQVEEGTNDDTIRFDTAGQQRMVVSNTGNVGIGTATPSANLDINGADNPQSGGIEVMHSNGTQAITMGYRGISKTGTNANSPITIDGKGTGDILLNSSATGNVGIGTATPTTTLDVVGDAATATSLDGITAPRLTGDQLKAKTYTATETGALVYVTAAVTGTAAGQTINVTAAGYYYFDGTVWNHWSLGAGGGGTSIADADGNTIIQVEEGTNDDTIRFDTNGQEEMTILPNGNVGIGTTTPTYPLHINGGDNTSISLSDNTNIGNNVALRMYHGGASGKGMGILWNDISNTDGALVIQRLNSTGGFVANMHSFSRNGNVGIGTTVPTDELHVEGDVRITGALKDSSNAAGAAGQILSTTSSGTDWIDAPTTGPLTTWVSGSGTTYAMNDLVAYNGVIYKSVQTTHVSGTTTPDMDATNWVNTDTDTDTWLGYKTEHHNTTGVTLAITHALHNNADIHIEGTGDLSITGGTSVNDGTNFYITNTTAIDRALTFTSFAGAYLRNGGTAVDVSGTGLVLKPNTRYLCHVTLNGTNYFFNATEASSSGGGSSDSLVDADGNTKIQVEEGTNDDTIRFDTNGIERLTIDSTGDAVLSGSMETGNILVGGVGHPQAGTGGTITTVGDYTIHTFTGSGTFTPNGNLNVEYLVVGGGGGGGDSAFTTNHGGGGGAGGFLTGTVTLTDTPQTVTVGAGGLVSENGQDSVFGPITALGGGGGGDVDSFTSVGEVGSDGGSGGGGGLRAGSGGGAGGLGTAGQGNAGGAAPAATTSGGGGGAGGAGNSNSGGGVGLSSDISGSTVFYAGGGGGTASPAVNSGVSGGGGVNGQNGRANSGGGGGGIRFNVVGRGGSGIVIVRYLNHGRVLVTDNENVGIGISTPTSKLHVVGDARFEGDVDTIGTIKVGTTTATPVAGMIRFNGTNFEGYNGTAWVQLNN